MASAKLLLRDEVKNKKGEHPIVIQILAEKKKILTLFSIDIKFWDSKTNRVKKSHPDSNYYNSVINTRFVPIQNRILELEKRGFYF